MSDDRVPTVAIVGRPNVGKSTLVNRIVGRREAIVEERPGVTRDRKELDTDWAGKPFTVVDTGGWMPSGSGATVLDDKVSEQSARAIAEADVALMVVDVRTGLTGDDEAVADLLRRRTGPTFVVANKCDDPSHQTGIWEFMSLGLGEPFPVSALHGHGSADLLDAIVADFDELPIPGEGDHDAEVEPDAVGIAIVGRPNVGKSTLFNHLIGEDRSVVHDQAGTTRDSIDTIVETDLGAVRFIDTAGMRRKARIDEETEYYSFVRALRSIDGADVALLVIDATIGVTHQDQRLAERVDVAGCPVVVVLNKWELLDTEARDEVADQVATKLRFLGDPPVLRISAISGKGVHRLLPILAGTIDDYHRRIPTREVNRVIRRAQSAHPAPGGARVLYATQGATDPPTFTLFVNRTIPRTYMKYIENTLRSELDMGTTPIKLRVRKRDD
ncbi:MAG: ribosome biogenesis GTPase Der [Actinomycetota bacterium]